MDDEQPSLFKDETIIESKPILSEHNKAVILTSLTGLSELGQAESSPHVRKAYKEYFDQLLALVKGNTNDSL
jgi:hypothetical protein